MLPSASERPASHRWCNHESNEESDSYAGRRELRVEVRSRCRVSGQRARRRYRALPAIRGGAHAARIRGFPAHVLSDGSAAVLASASTDPDTGPMGARHRGGAGEESRYRGADRASGNRGINAKTPGVGANGQAPGADAGHGATTAPVTAAEREDARLKLWAFCTSPHGLGLTEELFWGMSYTEINAHQAVYEQQTLTRWAVSCADFRNANRAADAPAWTPDDFLGRGDYAARKRQATRDKIDVGMLNAKLGAMRKGDAPPSTVPEWAIGEYRGRQAS